MNNLLLCSMKYFSDIREWKKKNMWILSFYKTNINKFTFSTLFIEPNLSYSRHGKTFSARSFGSTIATWHVMSHGWTKYIMSHGKGTQISVRRISHPNKFIRWQTYARCGVKWKKIKRFFLKTGRIRSYKNRPRAVINELKIDDNDKKKKTVRYNSVSDRCVPFGVGRNEQITSSGGRVVRALRQATIL